MLTKTALLLTAASSAATVSASTGYATMFRATTGAGTDAACTDNGAPTFLIDLTVGGCTPIQTQLAVVYAQLSDCSIDNGAWAMAIYLTPTCTGSPLMSVSGSDACDCATGVLAGIPVGARVTCGAPQNNCYWYQQYDGEVCDDPSAASAGTMGYYISGETCVDSNAEAAKITCLGGASTSAWNATLYEAIQPRGASSGDLAASSISACNTVRTVVQGSSCDTCATEFGDDFYGTMEGSTFKVNCGGFDPTDKLMCSTNAPPTISPSISPSFAPTEATVDDGYGDDDDDAAYGDDHDDDVYGDIDDDDRHSAASPFATTSFVTGLMATVSAVFLF